MINWGALGAVSLVSLAAGVVIVVLVALALVGLSAREPAADAGAADTADGTEPVGRSGDRPGDVSRGGHRAGRRVPARGGRDRGLRPGLGHLPPLTVQDSTRIWNG